MWRIAMMSVGVALALSPFAAVRGAGNAAPSEAGLVTITSLASDKASPQPVGTTVTWTATATNASPLEYRFEVRDATPLHVVQDYSPSNTLTWTEIHEGTYTVTVVVRPVGSSNPPVWTTSPPFQMTSLVVNGQPTVTATSNPLVALYSGPACTTGKVAVVVALTANPQNRQVTPPRPCDGKSVNVYVAGMRAQQTYGMAQLVSDGTNTTTGPVVTFTTGAPTVTFPPYTEPVPLSAQTSLQDAVVFLDSLGMNGPFSVATDLAGNVIWFYDPARYAEFSQNTVSHPVSGGTVLVILGNAVEENPQSMQTLREIDLAGNAIRQTTTGRILEQLLARGAILPTDTFDGMHHEAVRFPNGHTLVLGYVERAFPAGTQGAPGPVDVLGDIIIDLDLNFQVDWTWLGFDHLDVNRAAPLGETCNATNPAGCPFPGPALPGFTVMNDWTHSNTIAYSPSDGNLLLSMRDQDWILKIAYQNATGSGAVLWRLGQGGDFQVVDPSGNSFPWFSHQHGIENDVGPGLDRLDTFDNGNTRCATAPQPCNSRGQVYRLDETSTPMTATLQTNADLGGYSPALGWAQTLRNGDYAFTLGFLGAVPNVSGQTVEINPSGTFTFALQMPGRLYRAYRIASMYTQ